MIAVLIVFTLLIVLIFMSIEIPLTLGMATFLTIQFVQTRMTTASLAQIAATILPDSVTLICIPLFVFTGSLIANSILGQNLIWVANAIVGRIRGGLAIVNIVASFLFGGISGSASADTASIGGVLIPMMVKDGYDKDFSVVVTITSSQLGPIVPPSIIMIVFGWLTNTSIIGLFLAGYIPGMVLALSLILLSIYYSYKKNYPVSNPIPFKKAMSIIFKQLPIIFLPVGIIGGILLGVFSPTEAGAFGVIYGLIVLFLYGEIKSVDFNQVLTDVAATTGVCAVLLAFAGVFSRFLIFTKAPYQLAKLLIPYIHSPSIFLLMVMIIFLFLGTVMNPVAAMTMTLPILFPVSTQLHVHPLHFGIVTTVALAIGHVTPPVGGSLYIGVTIAQMQINEVIPILIRFVLVMILVCLIVIFFPGLFLWVPRLFGLG